MREKINVWSFVFSLICLFFFYGVSFSGPMDSSILGAHPLNMVLYVTMITLLIGLFGFSAIQDWKGMARSIITMVITMGLSAYLIFVIFLGSLLS